MKTPHTQLRKEIFNDSFFIPRSLIDDAVNYNDKNLLIPGSPDAGETINIRTRPNKNDPAWAGSFVSFIRQSFNVGGLCRIIFRKFFNAVEFQNNRLVLLTVSVRVKNNIPLDHDKKF
jgi:hypothetical protein